MSDENWLMPALALVNALWATGYMFAYWRLKRRHDAWRDRYARLLDKYANAMRADKAFQAVVARAAQEVEAGARTSTQRAKDEELFDAVQRTANGSSKEDT